jgi:hypothetical protein
MKHEMRDAPAPRLEDLDPADREALAGVLADLNVSAIKRGASPKWRVADEREPTNDEAMGMAWWNGLTESERAHWMKSAGTAVVADAWAAFKAAKRS